MNKFKIFYTDPDKGKLANRNLSERVAYVLLAYKYYETMSNNRYRSQDPKDKTTNAETWASMEGTSRLQDNQVTIRAGTLTVSQVFTMRCTP